MHERIMADFPQLRFAVGDYFKWSPETKTVHFINQNKPNYIWSLLHEIGHALSEHKRYALDIELIKMEREAWDQAIQISKNYNLTIDKNHIEDCMDTYRDWLKKRSTCPTCGQVTPQALPEKYTCFNCGQTWKVPKNTACRVVRHKIKQPAQ